jgi:hypothetical protein
VDPVVEGDSGLVLGVGEVSEIGEFLQSVVGDLVEAGGGVAVEVLAGVGEVVECVVTGGDGVGVTWVLAPGLHF